MEGETVVALVVAGLSAAGAILAAVYTGLQAREARRLRELSERALDEQADSSRRQVEQTQAAIRAAERSASASEQALEVARQSAENTIRAWLTVSNVTNSSLDESPFQVDIDIRNVGQTPAVNIRGVYNIEVLEGLPEKVEVDISVKGGRALGASPEPLRAWARRDIRPELSRIKQGDVKLVLVGKTFYEDVFGRTRSTGLCATYDLGLGRFVAAPVHNEIT